MIDKRAFLKLRNVFALAAAVTNDPKKMSSLTKTAALCNSKYRQGLRQEAFAGLANLLKEQHTAKLAASFGGASRWMTGSRGAGTRISNSTATRLSNASRNAPTPRTSGTARTQSLSQSNPVQPSASRSQSLSQSNPVQPSASRSQSLSQSNPVQPSASRLQSLSQSGATNPALANKANPVGSGSQLPVASKGPSTLQAASLIGGAVPVGAGIGYLAANSDNPNPGYSNPNQTDPGWLGGVKRWWNSPDYKGQDWLLHRKGSVADPFDLRDEDIIDFSKMSPQQRLAAYSALQLQQRNDENVAIDPNYQRRMDPTNPFSTGQLSPAQIATRIKDLEARDRNLTGNLSWLPPKLQSAAEKAAAEKAMASGATSTTSGAPAPVATAPGVPAATAPGAPSPGDPSPGAPSPGAPSPGVPAATATTTSPPGTPPADAAQGGSYDEMVRLKAMEMAERNRLQGEINKILHRKAILDAINGGKTYGSPNGGGYSPPATFK